VTFIVKWLMLPNIVFIQLAQDRYFFLELIDRKPHWSELMQSIEADLVHFTDLVLPATCLFPKQSFASTYRGIRWGGLQVVAVTISHRIIKTGILESRTQHCAFDLLQTRGVSWSLIYRALVFQSVLEAGHSKGSLVRG